jgi:hypothetical protein
MNAVNLNAFAPVGVLAAGGKLTPVPYRPYYPNGVKRTPKTRNAARLRHGRKRVCEFCGVLRRDMHHHLKVHHPGRVTAGQKRMLQVVLDVVEQLGC